MGPFKKTRTGWADEPPPPARAPVEGWPQAPVTPPRPGPAWGGTARPPSEAKTQLPSWRLPIAIVVLVLIYAGYQALQPPRTGVPASPPGGNAPADNRSAVTFSGSGSGTAKTTARHLSGDYSVAFTVTPNNPTGCYHSADLERADGQVTFETLGTQNPNDARAVTGTTNLYNLPATDYYVDVIGSLCSWTYTFTPS